MSDMRDVVDAIMLTVPGVSYVSSFEGSQQHGLYQHFYNVKTSRPVPARIAVVVWKDIIIIDTDISKLKASISDPDLIEKVSAFVNDEVSRHDSGR